MADSIPSLRRKLAEANLRISQLESRSALVQVQEVVKYIDRPVYVDRVRHEYIDRETKVYVTDPEQEAMIRRLQEELRVCRSSQLVL